MKYLRNERGLKKLGKRIRELRMQQNLTQMQLAFEAEISDVQLRRIEYGKINVGISTIFALAKALDVTLKEIFNFQDY